MSKYTKYRLYQKYETRGSQEAIPCYPSVFSIDGDGTMPLVIVEENSRDCGYTGETQPIYRWYTLPIDTYYYCDACQDAQYKWVNLPISQDWECVGTTKYYKQKKQVSVDGGSTWTDVTPPQYQRGALYEQNSQSCGYRTRTSSGSPYCEGYDKYVDVYSQYSTDGGNTWQTTATTPTMVEHNSAYCGYEIKYRTISGDPYCEGYDKYVDVYSQVSYDMGSTWETTATTPTMVEHNSYDCGYEIKYRTISGDPYCTGYDKYIDVYNQVSYDMGVTWQTTATTPTMVEHNSAYCGYVPPAYENQYLTLVAKGNGVFKKTSHSGTFQYSMDGGNTWATATSASTISVSNGDRVMFKGTLTQNFGVGNFSASTQFEAEGNPMSLLYGDNFIGQTSLSGKDYAFFALFDGCSGLTSIDNLKLVATTLTEGCYQGMFQHASITSIPSGFLPATTLANGCYANMFGYCPLLATVPSDLLPATTLKDNCYQSMFYCCPSLTTAPNLPATTLLHYCYAQMFDGGCTSLNYVKCLATSGVNSDGSTVMWLNGVAASGTFVKSSSMNSWPSGTSGIPTNWTVQNA